MSGISFIYVLPGGLWFWWFVSFFSCHWRYCLPLSISLLDFLSHTHIHTTAQKRPLGRAHTPTHTHARADTHTHTHTHTAAQKRPLGWAHTPLHRRDCWH